MFLDYLINLCGLGIYDRIILFDFQNIIEDDYFGLISEKYGYKLIYYDDVEYFRYIYETEIKKSKDKYLVIFRSDLYLPYDIRCNFYCKDISYREFFPKLNPFILECSNIFDLDLLYIAHENLYRTLNSEAETKKFLSQDVFDSENVEEYRDYVTSQIENLLKEDNYSHWLRIALLYSKLQYIKYKTSDIDIDEKLVQKIQGKFQEFILNNYSTLSAYSAYDGPVLINRTLDYIFSNSNDKFALLVMDGMSILDWLIISEGLKGISYKYSSTYALIPTITPISRQSLLSGKLPVELEKPFGLVNEEKLFIEKCKEYGYKEEETKYNRGYDFDIGYMDKCICVIINEIDDLVHSQKQGNLGMYNDVRLLSHSGKLHELIIKLYKKGFDVYIASDHGHIETETVGNPRGIGIEMETRSKRTLILKDYAAYGKIIEEFNLIEYPPYYLPRDYKYLLCEYQKSFGNKGNVILSHGGISIEEVIVPFIKIEGVDV